MLVFFLLLFGAVLAFWVQWRIKNRDLLKVAEQYPGPPAIIGLGNALNFMCNPEQLVIVIRDMLRDYGDTVRFWLGPDLNIVINNPDDAKVLLTNPKTSYKGPQYKYMTHMLGEGILSGSGPIWRKHRKIANPNYGKRSIINYSDIFNKEVGLLLEKYRRVQNTQIDLYRYIVQTTSYSVCQTLMGLTKEQTMKVPHIQTLIDVTPRLYDIVFDRMTKWYYQIPPVFWMTSGQQLQKQSIEFMKDFSSEIIRCRVEHLKTLTENNKKDLMQLEEDTQLSVIDRFILSGEFNEEELIQETFTIFTSSQEASAKIASFVLLMCAYHPKCQEKLYKEIREVIGDSDRIVTDKDLKKMTYLDMVFKEVLRLFPIGAMLQRTVTEDIAFGKGVLPKGCSLVFPIYHLQRDPRFWENPDAFDPERFTPENIKKRHPYCYIPFSIGPMDCLGRYFGTKLIKTISVRVMREFEIVPINKYEDMKLSIAISASSIDGYPAILKKRKNSVTKSSLIEAA